MDGEAPRLVLEVLGGMEYRSLVVGLTDAVAEAMLEELFPILTCLLNRENRPGLLAEEVAPPGIVKYEGLSANMVRNQFNCHDEKRGRNASRTCHH